MGKIKRLVEENPHGICESMVDSLQATIKTLQEQSQLSRAFETVIDYLERDNESDMNKYVLDLIAILRDLQYKVQEEEGN